MLAIGLVGVGFVFYGNGLQANQEFFDDNSGLRFSYSNQLKLENVSKERIAHIEHKEQPLLLSINVDHQQGGIKIASNTIGVSAQELVHDDIEKSARATYPELEVISKNQQTIAGRPGVVFGFTYQSPQGPKIQQKILVVIIGDDEALQIVMQAQHQDWEKVQQDYFSTIEESIEI